MRVVAVNGRARMSCQCHARFLGNACIGKDAIERVAETMKRNLAELTIPLTLDGL